MRCTTCNCPTREQASDDCGRHQRIDAADFDQLKAARLLAQSGEVETPVLLIEGTIRP